MTNRFHAFSIVVPSFNQASYLNDALKSLFSQKYPHLEIIVIDGGSTDGSVNILKTYEQRIFWRSEPDNGQSDALRKGFSLATGDWLGWLNSDDVLYNDALLTVNECINDSSGASVIVGGGNYIDEFGEYIGEYPKIDLSDPDDVLFQLFSKGYLPQPSTFFRRMAYLDVGGVNKDLDYAMDYDLWVRFANHGHRFVDLDHYISGNRWHKAAKTTSNLLELLSEVVNIQLREFGKVSPYFVQAISDNLYSRLHSPCRGDDFHLLFRNIYFKSVWLWLNYSSPLYCINGLLRKNIAKSGPVIGDEISNWQISRLLFKRVFDRLIVRKARKQA